MSTWTLADQEAIRVAEVELCAQFAFARAEQRWMKRLARGGYSPLGEAMPRLAWFEAFAHTQSASYLAWAIAALKGDAGWRFLSSLQRCLAIEAVELVVRHCYWHGTGIELSLFQTHLERFALRLQRIPDGALCASDIAIARAVGMTLLDAHDNGVGGKMLWPRVVPGSVVREAAIATRRSFAQTHRRR